jgi:hypothetical protein
MSPSPPGASCSSGPLVHCSELLELWWRLYVAGVLIAQDGLCAVSTAMDEAIVDASLDAFERAGP